MPYYKTYRKVYKYNKYKVLKNYGFSNYSKISKYDLYVYKKSIKEYSTKNIM